MGVIGRILCCFKQTLIQFAAAICGNAAQARVHMIAGRVAIWSLYR